MALIYIDDSERSAAPGTRRGVNDTFDPRPADLRLARDGEAALTGVYRKICCGVPREQSCAHDLPARAFDPGCGTVIMCRPAREWNR